MQPHPATCRALTQPFGLWPHGDATLRTERGSPSRSSPIPPTSPNSNRSLRCGSTFGSARSHSVNCASTTPLSPARPVPRPSERSATVSKTSRSSLTSPQPPNTNQNAPFMQPHPATCRALTQPFGLRPYGEATLRTERGSPSRSSPIPPTSPNSNRSLRCGSTFGSARSHSVNCAATTPLFPARPPPNGARLCRRPVAAVRHPCNGRIPNRSSPTSPQPPNTQSKRPVHAAAPCNLSSAHSTL